MHLYDINCDQIHFTRCFPVFLSFLHSIYLHFTLLHYFCQSMQSNHKEASDTPAASPEMLLPLLFLGYKSISMLLFVTTKKRNLSLQEIDTKEQKMTTIIQNLIKHKYALSCWSWSYHNCKHRTQSLPTQLILESKSSCTP